jgi:hypothetical protein
MRRTIFSQRVHELYHDLTGTRFRLCALMKNFIKSAIVGGENKRIPSARSRARANVRDGLATIALPVFHR